jgi:hypothetical protein
VRNSNLGIEIIGPWPGHRNLDEVQACETPVWASTYAHGLYTQYFWMKYKLMETPVWASKFVLESSLLGSM